MRSLRIIFVILQFSIVSLHAMEQSREIQEAAINPSSPLQVPNLPDESDYHENIIERTDAFYDARQRIMILINSIKILYPNAISDQECASINRWLAALKRRIDDIFDKGQAIKEEQDALAAISPDTSSQKRLELLMQLATLNYRCAQIVAAVIQKELSLRDSEQIKQCLKPLNQVARQQYFAALSFISHNTLPNGGIVAYLIGSRGYPYQEMPAFLEKLARDNPQIPITIYSIGSGLDKESAPEILMQRGIPEGTQDLRGQRVDFNNAEPVSAELKQLFVKDSRPLSDDQKESLIKPLRTYSIPTQPNVKLISCCVQLPLSPWQTGYEFFKKAFTNCIQRNLDAGSIVFIGNNTQCYNFEGVSLLRQVYCHFKHETKHPKAANLQLYTQGSQAQCIVYDPIESPAYPITQFYDHAGKLFSPENRIGLYCAATPFSQFVVEDGLRYHVQQIPQGGLAITHVSSNCWERPEILTTDGQQSRDPNHPEAPWEIK